MTVILASQSPRRRQLLGQMGFTDFKICPARGEEVAAIPLVAGEAVERLNYGEMLLRFFRAALLMEGV